MLDMIKLETIGAILSLGDEKLSWEQLSSFSVDVSRSLDADGFFVIKNGLFSFSWIWIT
jgi:hypothetical protein